MFTLHCGIPLSKALRQAAGPWLSCTCSTTR